MLVSVAPLAAVTLTVTVTDADVPLASSPNPEVTVEPERVQVPRPLVADTKVAPAGIDWVVVTAVAVPVLAIVCGAFVVSALDGPVPVVLGALVLAALAWYAVLRVRRPRALAAIGVYDEPSAADVHTGRGA